MKLIIPIGKNSKTYFENEVVHYAMASGQGDFIPETRLDSDAELALVMDDDSDEPNTILRQRFEEAIYYLDGLGEFTINADGLWIK